MRQIAAALLFMALAGAGAIALEGLAPFGRLALSFGYPAIATRLLDDPLWQGAALYRQGRYDEAAAMFRTAGPRGYYDRGTALARAGRYHEAVEVYDAHIYWLPHDEDARVNRALVAALVAVVGEARTLETGMTDGLVAGQKIAEGDTIAAALTRWKDNGRRTFADQSLPANRRWLTTLADEPGRYLKLRLVAEQKRRRQLGTAMAPQGDAW